MPLPICSNRTMSGVRFTSSSDTYNAIVEAYHNIADGEMDRVDFSVSVNGGGATVTSVDTREMWLPTDSTYDDPLPGEWGGGPAPIWGFGMALSMADYAGGYIDIVPTAYAASGESVTLPTIRVYNDKSSDNRPSTKVIYLDYINGDNANAGTSSGSAVKTFEQACRNVATSNDCGGGIIYIDSEGTHLLENTNNNYAFGANLYTSEDWWLQIMPRPGLTRENVVVTTSAQFDFSWMLFGGHGIPNSHARLKFSNLKIVPSLTFSSDSNTTLDSWLEHCLIEPPTEELEDEALSIRSYDYRSAPLGTNNLGPEGIRYATACSSSKQVFPGIGNWVRGWYANHCAGPNIQINQDDEAYTNVLLTNVHGNDVSGYFSAFSDSFRMETEGSNFRIQALGSYAIDIAQHAAYFSGSSNFGIECAGFSNGSNNDVHGVISGGYSGSLPYVTISGYGGTPVAEGAATVTINPAHFDGDNWEIKVHSDIVQFNVDDTANTILSNLAVFSGWETQGIFGIGHDITGVAIVNFYDGFVSETYSLPTRTYIASGNAKHFLVRNGTFASAEVDSTHVNDDSEWVDNMFSGFGSLQGTTTAYATQANMNYNHFIDVADVVGSNTTNGDFYNSATPALSVDATADASSTAYRSASALWDRPTKWDYGDRGAWNNVATADWSYSANTVISASVLTSSGEIPSTQPKLELSVGGLSSAGSIYTNLGGFTITSLPDVEKDIQSLTSVSSMPSVTEQVHVQIGTLISTSTVPVAFRSVTVTPIQDPEVELEGSETTSLSAITILPDESVLTTNVTPSDATASVGTAAQGSPGLNTFQFTVTDVASVSGTIVSTEPPRPALTSPPRFEIPTTTFTRTLTEVGKVQDSEIIPILKELNTVGNDITKVSTNSKVIWSQKILGSVRSPVLNRTVINMTAANYSSFSNKQNDAASRVILNRNRF